MESTRQKKIARLLERDFGEIFQRLGKDHFPGAMLSVTKVRVTPDLGIARVYVSMFPVDNKNDMIDWVRANSASIRNDLAQRVRHQLRGDCSGVRGAGHRHSGLDNLCLHVSRRPGSADGRRR